MSREARSNKNSRAAKMKANEIRAVLDSTKWLKATSVGNEALSPEARARLAQKWLKDGQIFSIERGDFERFPLYEFGSDLTPLPVLKEILSEIGPIRGWRFAVWIASANTWLDGRAPRECLTKEFQAILEAAKYYNDVSHG